MAVRFTGAGKRAWCREKSQWKCLPSIREGDRPAVGNRRRGFRGAKNDAPRQGSPVTLTRASELGQDLLNGGFIVVMNCL